MKPEQFGFAIQSRRKQQGLSLRALSKITGVPFGTIHGVENGRSPTLGIYTKLMAWLEPSASDKPDTLAAINATIFADDSLTDEAKRALSELITVAYNHMRGKEK